MTTRVPARRSNPSEQSARGKSFLEKAAYVVTPGTVVFGLLYYFGSTYRSAYYDYFGVRVSELELAPQDYVMGSTTAIFLPLLIAVVLGLLGVASFVLVDNQLSKRGLDRLRRQVSWALVAAGIGLLLLAFPVFLRPRWWQQAVSLFLASGWPRELLPPLIVAFGAILVMFGRHLRRDASRYRERVRAITDGLLIALVAMTLFFDMALYASGAGKAEAGQETNQHYMNMTGVVIHSREPISTQAYDACKDKGTGGGSYRFTCAGFRVLAKSKTRYFLLLERGKDVATLVLKDDDSIRVVVWKAS
ncbi:tripartite tricarboxylate transporter TctB family protein [Streptomyces sp. NPDC058691]|uniref:tripartite tricarboxylate transporter TctB family protein n=1 Tax=Streptomyces sp. NPDC058691 TaxID=3346601 RepID=UPI00365B28A0